MVPEPWRARRPPTAQWPQRLLRDSLVRFDGGSLPTLGNAKRLSYGVRRGPILLSGRHKTARRMAP
jgi:hypothetical protein